MSLLWLILLAVLAFGIGFWLTQRLQNAASRRSELGAAFPSPSRSPSGGQAALSPVQLEQQVRALIAQNQMIEAVKQVRQQTQWSLKESRAYVQAIAAGQSAVTPASGSVPMSSLPADVAWEVQQLVNNRETIAAIKRVREATGWDLRTAKAYVDRLSP